MSVSKDIPNQLSDLDTYWRGRRKISQLAHEYVAQLKLEDIRPKLEALKSEIFPAICFSRNIGVGALELAERLGKNMGRRVIDRQLIECISSETQLSEESIQTFDERRPGRFKEMLCMLLGDRAFALTDYARHLFVAAFFLAHGEKTIFVGRGIHLMLPRSRVFAVRCVGGMEMRITHIANSLSVDAEKARQIIARADQEQSEFFRKVHGKTDASTKEFDLVLNLDYIQDLDAAATAIERLFTSRFVA